MNTSSARRVFFTRLGMLNHAAVSHCTWHVQCFLLGKVALLDVGQLTRSVAAYAQPVSTSAPISAPGVPARQPRPISAAPRVEMHQGLGLPSVRNEGTQWGAQQPVVPGVSSATTGGMRRPESATGVVSAPPNNPQSCTPPPLSALDAAPKADKMPAVVLAEDRPQDAPPSVPMHKRAPPGVTTQAATSQPPAPAQVPEPQVLQMPVAAPEAGDAANAKKPSVLQMANTFAQRAEQSSPAPAPTIKWLSTDKVLKRNGNTVTKASPASPPPAEEYGVAVADIILSSGVHGSLPSACRVAISPRASLMRHHTRCFYTLV